MTSDGRDLVIILRGGGDREVVIAEAAVLAVLLGDLESNGICDGPLNTKRHDADHAKTGGERGLGHSLHVVAAGGSNTGHEGGNVDEAGKHDGAVACLVIALRHLEFKVARNGLDKIFGELAGFLFTWVAVLVLKPGSAAIISIIMGEYLTRAILGADAQEINPWINKVVALVGLAIVTFLNCVSTRVGTRVNDLLMFLKFVALMFVTVLGIVVAFTGFSMNGEANEEWKQNWFKDTSYDVSAWAVALYAGLWAYDGWDNVSQTLHVVSECLMLI